MKEITLGLPHTLINGPCKRHESLISQLTECVLQSPSSYSRTEYIDQVFSSTIRRVPPSSILLEIFIAWGGIAPDVIVIRFFVR
jgi:hypothetical protein